MKHYFPVILLACLTACASKLYVPNAYHGTPWKQKMQVIPGIVQCELYDEGGEGIAYHDTDSVNNGSGKLNPANGEYLHEFRMKEGVDISFTKPGGIDDNPYNQTPRSMQQLYVGWTQPGEWINYTVKVQETGSYRVGLQHPAHCQHGRSSSGEVSPVRDDAPPL